MGKFIIDVVYNIRGNHLSRRPRVCIRLQRVFVIDKILTRSDLEVKKIIIIMIIIWYL